MRLAPRREGSPGTHARTRMELHRAAALIVPSLSTVEQLRQQCEHDGRARRQGLKGRLCPVFHNQSKSKTCAPRSSYEEWLPPGIGASKARYLGVWENMTNFHLTHQNSRTIATFVRFCRRPAASSDQESSGMALPVRLRAHGASTSWVGSKYRCLAGCMEPHGLRWR